MEMCVWRKKQHAKQYVRTDSCVNTLWSVKLRDQKGTCSAVKSPVHHLLFLNTQRKLRVSRRPGRRVRLLIVDTSGCHGRFVCLFALFCFVLIEIIYTQLILNICGSYIGKFAYSLNFTCYPKINTRDALDMPRGVTIFSHSLMHAFPAEVKYNDSLLLVSAFTL